MIAKVVLDDREFYSFVFAEFTANYRNYAVVFDSKNNEFLCVKFLQEKPFVRRIVFIDLDKTNWIKGKNIKLNANCAKFFNAEFAKKVEGINWLLDAPNLLSDIIENKQIFEEYLQIASEINANINPDAWHIVKNKQDIEILMDFICGFHDKSLVGFSYFRMENYEDFTKIQMTFDTFCQSHFIMEFEENVSVVFDAPEAPITFFYAGSVLFDGEFFYWCDDDAQSVEDLKNLNVVKGKRLKWKVVPLDQK